MNNFTPSQHWDNHINHRSSYDRRGPTYLGEWTIQLPREEQTYLLPHFTFHPSKSTTGIGFKW